LIAAFVGRSWVKNVKDKRQGKRWWNGFSHFYMDNAVMKRFWLFFSQAVTVLLAALFIITTLKPAWLGNSGAWLGSSKAQVAGITVTEAPAPIAGASPVGSFRAAAQKASAAVVSINVSKNAVKNSQMDDPWFKFFFGERGQGGGQQGGQGSEPQQAGLGSGVIVSADGYILTNNHVVEGADEIEVILNDSRRAIAKVIGTDPDSDLAILKITLDKLPTIVLGNSDALQVGDQVLAIGNPFGVGQTVTSGIVSALNKNQLGINTFENFIQTDAAINPGNSGGALVDVNGNLQGINTAIYSRSGGSLGIGFAIPVSTAKQVMEGIVKDGQVTRGWIGVEPQDLSPELAVTFGIKNSSKSGEALQGVIITGVLQGAPAAKAGIVPGDIIVSIAGKQIRNVSELLTQVSSIKPGNSEKFGIIRKETALELSVAAGTRPRPKVQPR
jgi:serine protease DegQ